MRERYQVSDTDSIQISNSACKEFATPLPWHYIYSYTYSTSLKEAKICILQFYGTVNSQKLKLAKIKKYFFGQKIISSYYQVYEYTNGT